MLKRFIWRAPARKIDTSTVANSIIKLHTNVHLHTFLCAETLSVLRLSPNNSVQDTVDVKSRSLICDTSIEGIAPASSCAKSKNVGTTAKLQLKNLPPPRPLSLAAVALLGVIYTYRFFKK